jgi:molybdenum cofactor biosynthesis enzyme MoaA
MAKVRVSAHTLTQRINRKLRARGEVLKKTRGTQAYLECGDFYVLDMAIGAVVRKHVDLEELGRELSALQPHEELV